MADVQNPTPTSASKTDGGVSAVQDAARAAVDAGARQAKDNARAAQAVADETAEASSAAANDTAQKAVYSGLDAGMRSIEALTQACTRAFGVATPKPDLAEQSALNVQAVSQASTALAKGAQQAARVWFDLSQTTLRTNLAALGQIASCRSFQEVMTLQSSLLRDNLQHAIESGDAIARASSDAIREATRAMHPQA